jgi:outer membrane protein insertion porin family
MMALMTVLNAAAQMPTVRDIRVEHLGPGILDAASVLTFIQSQPGDTYDPAAINQDVRMLQETERFSSVSAQLVVLDDGKADLVYVIRSKPRLRSVRVEGAQYFSNRRVRDILELRIGDPVDDRTMAIHVQKVYERYRKRYYLDPKLTWEMDVNEESGAADVRIQVVEGKRAGVWRVEFEGNDNIAKRPLRRAMQQKAWRPWSWLFKGNTYDPFVLDMDRDAIRREYLNRGYLDVEVGEPRMEPGPGKLLRVVIPIEEGDQYRLRQIEFSGISLFPEEDVLAAVRLNVGDVASIGALEEARNQVRDFYGSRGYIRTFPRYRVEADYDEAVIDVDFALQEGNLSHIREIQVRGNTVTKDKVIRRELAVFPGDIFDEVRVRRSENRLRNMGYFNAVRSIPVETDERDIYDLTIDVEEGRSGMISAGVGFSSIDRAVGFIDLSQNNFDLFNPPWFRGGGQKLQLRTQFGSRRSDLDLTFVEPWFLDRQLSFDINLFRRENRYDSRLYEQRNTGFETGLAKPVGRFSRLRLSYSLEEIQINNVQDEASQIFKDEEGKRIKSAVGLTLTRDTRDNFFVPTRGNRLVLGATVAGGPLQGDTDTYSLSARMSQHYPLWFQHVLTLRGAVAVVDYYGDSERVPLFDRLFMGGPRTIRGFRFRDVGPRDDEGEPVGGQSSAFASVEYTIPLNPTIRLATFYDIGMVWPDAYEFETSGLNSSVGIGIRFDIPQFPLRFDFAWPLLADEFNDRSSGRFSFFIGHIF